MRERHGPAAADWNGRLDGPHGRLPDGAGLMFGFGLHGH
jgi:hypothetical protein